MRGLVIILMMVFFTLLSNSVFADTIVRSERGNEYRIELRSDTQTIYNTQGEVILIISSEYDIEKIKMIINCRETKDNGR